MSSWTIHLPPAAAQDISQTERFVAVKDGLRPLAVLFGPLWFLAKRLWWGFLSVALIEAALFGLAWWLPLPRPIPGLLQGLFHLLLGLEASSVQRWTLRRRGWREVGAIIAHGRAEAETRAASLLADLPPPPAPAPLQPVTAPVHRPVPAGAPAVLGLFPEARPR